MAGIPALKKKLKGINATKKISAAMKTVSAAKFARLNARNRNFCRYAEQFGFLYKKSEKTDVSPDIVIVLAGNRGLCGAFNASVASLAAEKIAEYGGVTVITLGLEAERRITELAKMPEKAFNFGDMPTFEDCSELFCYLDGFAEAREHLNVAVVYPKYINTLTQIPTVEVFDVNGVSGDAFSEMLSVPDAKTVTTELAKKGFNTLLFGKILETALGAQAATLMTMRSAYDTATEYSEALELEIQRKRQAKVTADVIETSSEHKGDNENV